MMVIFLHDNVTCFAVDVGFFFLNTEKIELDDVERRAGSMLNARLCELLICSDALVLLFAQ